MQSHANSLARIESDWTLRDGVNSLISNISCTKHQTYSDTSLGRKTVCQGLSGQYSVCHYSACREMMIGFCAHSRADVNA